MTDPTELRLTGNPGLPLQAIQIPGLARPRDLDQGLAARAGLLPDALAPHGNRAGRYTLASQSGHWAAGDNPTAIPTTWINTLGDGSEAIYRMLGTSFGSVMNCPTAQAYTQPPTATLQTAIASTETSPVNIVLNQVTGMPPSGWVSIKTVGGQIESFHYGWIDATAKTLMGCDRAQRGTSALTFVGAEVVFPERWYSGWPATQDLCDEGVFIPKGRFVDGSTLVVEMSGVVENTSPGGAGQLITLHVDPYDEECGVGNTIWNRTTTLHGPPPSPGFEIRTPYGVPNITEPGLWRPKAVTIRLTGRSWTNTRAPLDGSVRQGQSWMLEVFVDHDQIRQIGTIPAWPTGVGSWAGGTAQGDSVGGRIGYMVSGESRAFDGWDFANKNTSLAVRFGMLNFTPPTANPGTVGQSMTYGFDPAANIRTVSRLELHSLHAWIER